MAVGSSSSQSSESLRKENDDRIVLLFITHSSSNITNEEVVLLDCRNQRYLLESERCCVQLIQVIQKSTRKPTEMLQNVQRKPKISENETVD